MIPLAGRSLDLGFAALAASQLTAATVLAPGDASLGVTCLSRASLGVECPFCGMTRSFVALAHGQPGAAFEHHPAGPFLMLAMLAFTAAAVVVAARGITPLFERRRFVRSAEAVALVCVAIGVAHLMRS